MIINPNPWPYKYIRMLAEEATVIAKDRNLRPTTARQALASRKSSGRFNVPFLGDYVPEGWKQLEEIEPFFVDCTGRRRAGESNAITYFEFQRRIEQWVKKGKSIGLGIVEMGQTQVLVAVYTQ